LFEFLTDADERAVADAFVKRTVIVALWLGLTWVREILVALSELAFTAVP
jgi:uncharacterized membrane protein